MIRSTRMATPQYEPYTALPTPTDTQTAYRTPATFAQSLRTSEDDNIMNVTLVSRFPRQLPQDILVSICAALRDMMWKQHTARQVILQTFLGIQVVSKACWRAVTPFIWEWVKLTSNNSYTSFFSPITRLLELSRERGLFKRSQILDMVKDDARCPDEVHRFFMATPWIGTIDFHLAPPESIRTELWLMGDLAMARLGTLLYLRVGIQLQFFDSACSLLLDDKRTNEFARLRSLVQSTLPADISVWGPPEWNCSMSWKNFEEISDNWEDAPLFIYDLVKGQLRCCSHRSVTVVEHSRGPPDSGKCEIDYESLSMEVGPFIANRMLNHDPDCTETRLDIQLPMDFFLRTRSSRMDEDEGAVLGIGEAVIEDHEAAIERTTEETISVASRQLRQKGHLGCDEHVHAERIRDAFESGRLAISLDSGL